MQEVNSNHFHFGPRKLEDFCCMCHEASTVMLQLLPVYMWDGLIEQHSAEKKQQAVGGQIKRCSLAAIFSQYYGTSQHSGSELCLTV